MLAVRHHDPEPQQHSVLSCSTWVRAGDRVFAAMADAAGDWGLGGEAAPFAAPHLLAGIQVGADDLEQRLRSAFEDTTRAIGPKFHDDMGIAPHWSSVAAVLGEREATVAWAGSAGVAHLRGEAVLWRSSAHLLVADPPDGHPLKMIAGRLQGDPRNWAPPQVQRLELEPGDVVLLYSRAVEKLFTELGSDHILTEPSPVHLVDKLVAFCLWEPSLVWVGPAG